MQPGTRLEHYEILDKIGEGGMGAVYRADDTRLKRQVAVKVLPPEMSADAERMARLEREAQLLASLSHPNVATVHGFGQQQIEGEHGPQTVTFLVMELLDGQSLGDRLDDGPIPWAEAVEIARGIASGLEAAHERGIVHRDLKPANVQLLPDGTVKVLDFGLAKAFEGDGTSGSLDLSASPTVAAATRTGMILGTASYMSPEQARGKSVDKRTDIWAFGCVLWEMLTGRKVFRGDTVSDILASILKEEPDNSALPADLPLRARQVLDRCMEKNPARRMRDIGDVRLELEAAKADPTPASAVASAVGPAAWKIAVPVALAALVVGAIAGRAMVSTPPAPEYRVMLEAAATARAPGGVAISPDGRWIAQMQQEPAGPIRIRPVDDMQWREVPDTEGSLSLMFTADGQELLFTRDTELLRVRVVGSSPINEATLAQGQGDTAVRSFFGEDGRLYLSGAGPSGVSLLRLDPRGDEELWRGEGEFVMFTGQLNDDLYLAWRPAFAGNTQNRIELFDSSTGEFRELLDDYTDARHLGDGRVVSVDVRGRLALMRLDTATGELLEAPSVAVDGLALSNGSFPIYDVSNGGALVYVAGGATTNDGETLAWLGPTGGLETVSERAAAYDADSRISPDGNTLALEIGNDGVVSVWLHDVARDVQTPLVPGRASSFPVWSPDGTEIILRMNAAEGVEGGIYRIPADRSAQPALLLADPEGRFVLPQDWSPDGRTLLYIESDTLTRADGSRNDLWLLPVDGGEPRAFLATTADETDARFSRDGAWVAFDSNQSGRGEIYLRAVDGGGEIAVSGDGGTDPEWSADGRSLLFRNGPQIFSAAIDFGPPLRTSAPEPFVMLPRFATTNTYAVDPQGRGLLITTTDTVEYGGLNAIFNWQPDVPQ
jgi:Tol biopolymer transport system component